MGIGQLIFYFRPGILVPSGPSGWILFNGITYDTNANSFLIALYLLAKPSSLNQV